MTPQTSQPLIAAAWMTGAIAAFSAMAVAGRAVSSELDTFETMLFRSLIGIVLVVSIGGITGHLREVTTRRMPEQILRNIFHFTGQNHWFYGVTVIPLTHLFALEFTSPLWVMVLAALFLGERLTWIKGAAALLAFTGVLMVVRPDTSALNPGHVAAALSAIAFAATAIFTKKLTQTETITCILFHLTVIQAILGVICAGYDGDITLPSMATLPWVVIIACAGLAAHFCLTTALRHAPASVVMPMDFARLPVIALIGVLVYQEALQALVVLGAGLILFANWLNIRAEIRQRHAKQTA